MKIVGSTIIVPTWMDQDSLYHRWGWTGIQWWKFRWITCIIIHWRVYVTGMVIPPYPTIIFVGFLVMGYLYNDYSTLFNTIVNIVRGYSPSSWECFDSGTCQQFQSGRIGGSPIHWAESVGAGWKKWDPGKAVCRNWSTWKSGNPRCMVIPPVIC